MPCVLQVHTERNACRLSDTYPSERNEPARHDLTSIGSHLSSKGSACEPHQPPSNTARFRVIESRLLREHACHSAEEPNDALRRSEDAPSLADGHRIHSRNRDLQWSSSRGPWRRCLRRDRRPGVRLRGRERRIDAGLWNCCRRRWRNELRREDFVRGPSELVGFDMVDTDRDNRRGLAVRERRRGQAPGHDGPGRLLRRTARPSSSRPRTSNFAASWRRQRALPCVGRVRRSRRATGLTRHNAAGRDTSTVRCRRRRRAAGRSR